MNETKDEDRLKNSKKELYELLPWVYRQRDIEEGMPLKHLLDLFAEQVEVLKDDIEGLYNNWFIETCEPWVIPYIGDLLKAKILEVENKGTINTRAFVANTIGYRRRKGTLSMLQQLARDVTGWKARAVEFFKLLSTTQYLNHLRPSNLHTPDLREIETMDLLETPFDTIAHTVDVRDINLERGFHNIPNIGIFLWRLQAYPVYDAPAFKIDDDVEGKFTFSQLGHDMPLFNHPITEMSLERIAEETNVPSPIRRLGLFYHLNDYYYVGEDEEKSIRIKVDGVVKNPVDIAVYNLSNWERHPTKIAIDPVLGRILFPEGSKPESVHVSYWYGFSSEVGGGFYQRPSSDTNPTKTYIVSKNSSLKLLSDAINQWYTEGNRVAIIEIADSEVYEEELTLNLPSGFTLEIRAEQEQRPVLRCSIEIMAETSSDDDSNQLIFDGLLIDGSIAIKNGYLDCLTLRHCTLVPKEKKSLLIQDNHSCLVTLDRTISGAIESLHSNAKVILKDSIVDGKGKLTIKCFELTSEESTILGGAEVEKINLISNTIFTDVVIVKRRQMGCVRFSLIPLGSKVPRRHRCQPEFLSGFLEDKKNNFNPYVRPHFTSVSYGDPSYAQLGKHTPSEIFEGADDGAEMGVFNHLQQVHRINSLKSCLDEYTRFGLKIGLILVS